MVFIVNPAEAQALQEDEAQLMAAIAQASRSIPGLLYISQTTVTQTSEQLRIQMGRRVVYGQLADGPFRNELNSNSLRVIFDALQKPVTEGADPKLYQGKIPTIEIRNGETILFREERDGTITINEIQLQTEQEAVVEQPSQTPVAVQERPETIAIAQIARWLLNPLGDELPLYEAVTVQGYRVAGEGDRITVTKGSNLVLVEQNGEVVADRMTQEDLEIFQSFQQRNDHQPLREQPVRAEFDLPDLSAIEEQSQPATEVDVIDAPLFPETPPAIATLERETTKLPDGETKEFLQATTQNWKQQFQEGLKVKIQHGFNWLISRPEVLQNRRLAHAAIELFNRGYERTGERSYQVGEYIINFKGGSLYTLRDNRGELMRFQTTKSIIPGMGGRQVQVLAVSDRLSDFQRQELLAMQRDRAVMPQGDMDVEANYAARTRRVKQTVRGFLRNHAKATVWDKEGGMFKLEMGAEGYLCITDKQNGRGVVFQRQNGEVFSKLGAKDFAHFDRLATRMQQVDQQQPLQQAQPPSHFKMWLPQHSPALELE